MNETTSRDRIEWARAALAAFLSASDARRDGTDTETAIGDLVTDLLHLAEAEGCDVGRVLRSARLDYDAESAGEPETPPPIPIDKLVASAREHGENNEGFEDTLSDLWDMLNDACELLTPDQRIAFWNAERVKDLTDNIPEYAGLNPLHLSDNDPRVRRETITVGGADYEATLTPNLEDGGYSVEFETTELEGCFTQGDTILEAMANAAEAITIHLDFDAGDARPLVSFRLPFEPGDLKRRPADTAEAE